MAEIKVIKVIDPKLKLIRTLDEVAMADLDEYPPEKHQEDIPIYRKLEDNLLDSFLGKKEESEEEKEAYC